MITLEISYLEFFIFCFLFGGMFGAFVLVGIRQNNPLLIVGFALGGLGTCLLLMLAQIFGAF